MHKNDGRACKFLGERSPDMCSSCMWNLSKRYFRPHHLEEI